MNWNKTSKRVAVLGAGPAGLLAAFAASAQGYQVTVFSAPSPLTGKVVKSELHGCQYLHMSIPNLTTESAQSVSYHLNGSVEEYRRKVYGEGWNGQVSPDEYGPEGRHYAWDLRKAYDRLWEWAQFMDVFASCHLSGNNAYPLYEENRFVISTVPAPALCTQRDKHKFPTQDIWAMGGRSPDVLPEHGEPLDAQLHVLPYYAPNFAVECNGEPAPRWYRAATVFGHSTLEWPAGAKPPISGVVAVSKPLSTDCDCWSDNRRWLRAGRYGRWQKGTLVHSAYFDTLGLLS